MEGSVAPNVGEVTSTGSQGYQPEMNLRSVFSAEQQRILQRYYDSGMTNQSKSCFQLILQCAQETKLDFSVVRTWVGNKRRKMSSKTYVETGGQLQGSVSNSPSRPQEATVRTMPNLSRSQQPPPRSSSGADLIMTCVYSPNNSSTRPGTTIQTSTPKADLLKPVLQRAPVRTEAEYHKLQAPMQRPAPVVKACLQLMEEKTVGLPRPQNAANATNSIYAAKKNYMGSGQMVERIAPQKTMTWPVKNVAEAPGGQRLHKAEQPNQSPIPHLSSGQRPRDSTCGLKNLEIREVFSLAPGEPSSRTLGAALEERPRVPETNCFSIAMETGDVNDEYAREEELASMAAQNQLCSRFKESNSSPRENRSALSPVPVRTGGAKALQPNSREGAENPAYHSDYYMSLNTSAHNTSGTQYPGHNAARSSGHRHYSIAAQPGGMVPNSNNYQISGNLTVPWITECSRKRTLQDRTQFSDHDLAMLKKYWDNGMTSLGSVCREKIEAVASELNVDCEIVRTWIGNRRRKYRLMGIEVPPPRGGPATFSEQLESASSLTPSEDPVAGVVEENDRHDEVSICLSEESSQADDVHEVGRNEDLSIKEDSQDMAPPHNVKVEAPEEEMSESLGKFDVEQMRSLLDYKNEDVRYMESELERYKQKFTELQAFTRSLIHAVRTNDRDQQQILLSEPPLDLEDMDFSHMSPDPDDTSYSVSSMSEGTAQTSCERPDSGRKELMDFTKV